MENHSFIREVAKMGDDLVIRVPRELRDLFEGKRVKVVILDEDNIQD